MDTLTPHPSYLELKAPESPKDPSFDSDGVFQKYYGEVGPKFQNIPEDAFREWLYCFWHDHIKTLYSNLDFHALDFGIERWPLEKCLSVQWYSRFNRVEGVENGWTIEHIEKLYLPYNEEVVDAALNCGSWFKPIWVLDSLSFEGIKLHHEIKIPFMLVEGHTRLGTLRMLNNCGKAGKNHSVWVIRAHP